MVQNHTWKNRAIEETEGKEDMSPVQGGTEYYLDTFEVFRDVEMEQYTPKGWGCSSATPPPNKLKTTDFLDMLISRFDVIYASA